MERSERAYTWVKSGVELMAILALFFLLAGEPPPGVNEAHYLAKARHYWEPNWCAGDLFLESADAHLVFYWTLGWLTLFLPLPAVAWVGRWLVWLLLAVSLQRLSRSIVHSFGRSVLTVGLFAWLLTIAHFSGEWVIGGVEAKGIAYAAFFFALERMVRGDWNSAWCLLGLACAFHVLVGGWAVVAAGGAWFASGPTRPSLRSMWPALSVGLLLALAGLLPALALGQGVDSATVAAANEIYVHRRLSHHLLFHEILRQQPSLDFAYLGLPRWTWPTTHGFLLRHLLLLSIWLGLVYRLRPTGGARTFHLVVAMSLGIALVGIVIDQATLFQPALAAKWLRYYWFRLSDTMLPLGVAIAFVQTLQRWSQSETRTIALATRQQQQQGLQGLQPLERYRQRRANLGTLCALLAILGFALDAFWRHRWDPRPAAVRQAVTKTATTSQQWADWQAACHWIKQHTPPGSVVLTPRHQQTFKWYAERAEVVNWKDVPQDAAGIVQWWERKQAILTPEVSRHGLAAIGSKRLSELAEQYHFQFILTERATADQQLDFERLFPPANVSNAYEVYRVPNRAAPPESPPSSLPNTD